MRYSNYTPNVVFQTRNRLFLSKSIGFTFTVISVQFFVVFLNVLQFLCVQLISRQELATRWQCLTTTPSLVVYQRTRYIMNHPTCQTVTLRETICLLFPSEIEIAQPRMFVAFDEILMVKCVYRLGITYYYNMYLSRS